MTSASLCAAGAPAARAGGRGRGEAGAYLVLYALLAVGFFTVAAVVLDVAALRQGRRADRTAADLAVTAGVTELNTSDPATFAGACEAAWGYLLANRSQSGGTITAPPCNATFPAADACTPATPARTAAGSIGGVTIEITHPVPDSSPLMLAEVQGGDLPQGIDGASDGTACERLGVRVVRSRTFLFGQIAGTTGGRTDVHAVARALTTTSTTEVPGLVSLDRTGCDGVVTGPGSGHLDVAGVGQGGVIVVDSDGSGCGAGGFAIRPDATGRIRAVPAGPASGLVSSFALAGTNFPAAYDPADVGAGRLAPQPTPSIVRTGRTIIDNRYNCTAGTCAAGSDEVDRLEAALGGPGRPAGFTPAPDPACVVPAGIAVVAAGDVYVDCPVFEVFGQATFSGANVVFAGDVVVRAGGCAAVNSGDCGAAGTPLRDGIAFVRGSVVKEPAAGVFLRQTFVWAGSHVDLPLDPDPMPDSALQWSAPLGGRFQDLLLWDESSSGIRVGEQDTTVLEGTLFAPNTSAVVLEGRPGGTDLDVPLQVVASRVRLEGDGDVTLSPAPGRATGRLARQVRLVR